MAEDIKVTLAPDNSGSGGSIPCQAVSDRIFCPPHPLSHPALSILPPQIATFENGAL